MTDQKAGDGGEPGLQSVFAKIERTSLTVGAIITAIGSIVAASGVTAAWAFPISAVLLGVGVAWFAFGVVRRRSRKGKLTLAPKVSRPLTLIRGPFPMEERDDLLGRDRELDLLTLLVSGRDFLCGFLTGEAGAGKTSLLRAGLLKRLNASDPPQMRCVYVARSGADPARAVWDEISAGAANAPAEEVDAATAVEGFLASQQNTIFIVLDQFEEFFLLNKTPRKRNRTERFFESILKPRAAGPKVRLMLSLRKEFVDDLLALFEALGIGVDRKNRFSLVNFTEETAGEILEEIARREHLPFSPDLRRRVIADLARDQRVRPVEFQLVLSRMLEHQIVEVRTYSDYGGAWGIISRYIADEIGDPAGSDELERLAARHLLRALCSQGFDARRPQGLTEADLYERVLDQLKAHPTHTATNSRAVQSAVREAIARLRTAYILVDEADGRVNLAHDYLAPAVRDATSGLETAEERANRILEQYASRARGGERFVVLPWREFRLVRAYGDPELKQRTFSQQVIRRSSRLYWGIGAAAALFAVGVPTALTLTQPTGWVTRPIRTAAVEGDVMLSGNGNFALVLAQGRLSLIDLLASSPSERHLADNIEAVLANPREDEFMALRSDGVLLLARRNEGYQLRPQLNLGWRRIRFGRGWSAYSGDGKWRFATTLRGQVFAWTEGTRPVQIGRFESFGDLHGNALPPGTIPRAYTGGNDDVGSVPPRQLIASRDGRHLAVPDGQRLRLWRTTSPRPPVIDVPFNIMSSPPLFSPSGDSVAWYGTEAVMWKNLASESPPRALIPIQRRWMGGQLAYSPSGRWLVVRLSSGPFHTWRVGSPSVSAPIVPPPPVERRSSSDAPGDIVFDRDERFVASRGHDFLAYVWELADHDPRPLPVRREATDLDQGRLQSVMLCADGRRALLALADGSLHRLDTTTGALLHRVADRTRSAFPLQLRVRRTEDSDVIYAWRHRSFATGECSNGAFQQWTFGGPITDVRPSGQGARLSVVTDREIIQLERRFVVWGIGIPSLTTAWPALEGAGEASE